MKVGVGISFACLALMAFISQGACAEPSKKKALLGRAMWSAFECSALAAQSGDRKTAEHLFNYGYRQGKAFVTAISSKEIDQRDLSIEVPAIVLALLEGPTHDFMLGRIYSSAEDNALKDLLRSTERSNTGDVRGSLAKSKYTAKNCGLIAAAAN